MYPLQFPISSPWKNAIYSCIGPQPFWIQKLSAFKLATTFKLTFIAYTIGNVEANVYEVLKNANVAVVHDDC